MQQPSYQTMPSEGGHTSVYIGNPQNFQGFDNKRIRNDFVSKVYGILSIQLLFATALIAWFVLHEPTKEYFKTQGAVIMYAALAGGIVLSFILICFDSVRRAFPLNFILLSLFTLCYGLLAAIMSSRYDTITVLCAFGATAFSTFMIMILAKYAPFDITTCGCGLCILGLLHLFASIVLILILVPLGYAKLATLLLAGSGAFLVSLYLLFDLQLIMGGRAVELSPEEYILGAVLLYTDIINLFQYLLILFGSLKE